MDLIKEVDKYVPQSFPRELVLPALKYPPESGDLFVASYPKCGTTWIQQIVYLLTNDGTPPVKSILFHKSIPFLEFTNPVEASEMPKPRSFKSHLPFHLIPYNSDAKYIYCMRNPKDCCVSFWYHERDFPLIQCNSFDEFFELFMEGKTGYGDYFDHIDSWYSNKSKNNILVVHFEKLKNNFNAGLETIANFINPDLVWKMRANTEFRDNVVKFSSFDFMKQSTNQQIKDVYSMPVQDLIEDEDMIAGFRDAFSKIRNNNTVSIASEVNFIRKGIVGDWRTHLSEQQNNRINEKIGSYFNKYPELIDFWKKLDLF